MPTLSGLIAVLMWGLLAVFSTFTRDIPPFQLLVVCFSISFLLIVIKRLIQQKPVFKPSSMTSQQWLVHTLCLFGFHFCYFMAIRYAPPVEVSLIGYLWPLLLGIYVAPQGLRLFALAGGLLGFAGSVFLVLSGESLSADMQYLPGYLLAFTCALIWSGYSWFLSRSHSEVEDIGWVSLLVAVLSLIAHLWLEQTQTSWTASELCNALLLGLGPIGGAFYLWDIGMKNGDQSLLASISFATPVISAVALYAAGFSPLSTAVIVAVSLILSGALITNNAQRIKHQLTKRRMTA
ncbi:DMT family transporter [Salinimonas lutimaris]|uniref:DMT family transporter n=1 Tax=Salinimonas lutimaris TaxID=914153 RepID=UPI0010C00805|nr:EamA family transporter [Salinimonas lutimaris]